MSLLKQFEKEIGFSVQELTEEKLIEILTDEEYSHFFTYHSRAVELFDEIIPEIENDLFLKELNTVRHTLNLSNIADLLQKLFESRKKEEITDEEFQEKIQKNFESEDPIYVISTLVCLLLSKHSMNIDENFESFKNNIVKIKDIFSNLGRIENSYSFRIELIDLLYTAQQEYFFIYEKDLLEGINWLEEEVDKITEFENNFNPETFEEIDITPEDLGLIDITKLPKEGYHGQ